MTWLGWTIFTNPCICPENSAVPCEGWRRGAGSAVAWMRLRGWRLSPAAGTERSATRKLDGVLAVAAGWPHDPTVVRVLGAIEIPVVAQNWPAIMMSSHFWAS